LEAVDYINRIEGLEAQSFLAAPEDLRRLLRLGLPVILFHEVFHKGEYRGHASVIVGFDERFGIFLLEDANWFSSRTVIPFGHAKGARALLVAPRGRMVKIRPSLACADFCDLIDEAENRLANGDTGEATLALLEAAAEKRPCDLHLCRLMGRYWTISRGPSNEKTLDWRKRALLSPAAGSLEYSILGHQYLVSGNADMAEVALLEALAREPFDLSASIDLAEIARQREQPDVIERYASRAIEVAPTNGTARLLRGYARLWKCEWGAAVHDLELAVSYDGPVEALWFLAFAYKGEGDVQGAQQALHEFANRSGTTKVEHDVALVLKKWEEDGDR
jgi:tetratricopeptide (TPR) repeat protein